MKNIGKIILTQESIEVLRKYLISTSHIKRNIIGILQTKKCIISFIILHAKEYESRVNEMKSDILSRT